MEGVILMTTSTDSQKETKRSETENIVIIISEGFKKPSDRAVDF